MRSPARLLAALPLLAAVLAAAVPASAAAPTRKTWAHNKPTVHHATAYRTASSAKRMYWGAWIGSQLTGQQAPWDFSAVERFEQNSGKRLSLLQFSSPFFSCASMPCAPNKFPSTPFEAIRRHGAIPFFSWNSASTPITRGAPNLRLQDVAAGRYDAYITEWATSAARWGKPFFLRFNWEMNADWFPWAEGVNGNAPGSYVAAWRHVHDIFTAVGARNATWVWCPNVDPTDRYTALKGLYPGNQYVDWTCLDGYSYGPESAQQSFSALFTKTYNQIITTIAPKKPMVIGETAALENRHKAAWISDALKTASSLTQVKGFMYFENVDTVKRINWAVETSASSQSAFRAGVAAPAFVPNQYAQLNTSPIPAP
jgi:hypothetical protein